MYKLLISLFSLLYFIQKEVSDEIQVISLSFIRKTLVPITCQSYGRVFIYLNCKLLKINYLARWRDIWDKVFKNGPSKIYGKQNSKNLKRYGLLKETVSLQIF